MCTRVYVLWVMGIFYICKTKPIERERRRNVKWNTGVRDIYELIMRWLWTTITTNDWAGWTGSNTNRLGFSPIPNHVRSKPMENFLILFNSCFSRIFLGVFQHYMQWSSSSDAVKLNKTSQQKKQTPPQYLFCVDNCQARDFGIKFWINENGDFRRHFGYFRFMVSYLTNYLFYSPMWNLLAYSSPMSLCSSFGR